MPEVPEVPRPEVIEGPETPDPDFQRWPRVIGTIGIIVGLLMFLDQLDDLVMLPLLESESWWAGLIGDELAATVMLWMPSTAWMVTASLTGMALGALLVIGALRLRRGRRSGANLCRAWAWITVAWLVAEVGWIFRWFTLHASELDELVKGADWQGPVGFGIAVALAVLAAFPAFLLSWFSRPGIKAQVADWPR